MSDNTKDPIDLASLHEQVSEEIARPLQVPTMAYPASKSVPALLDAIVPQSPEAPPEPKSEIQQQREKAKAAMLAYREQAVCWALANSTGRYPISVSTFANVQVVDSGAFVECQVFVPAYAIEAKDE